jgi:hypothetical protein
VKGSSFIFNFHADSRKIFCSHTTRHDNQQDLMFGMLGILGDKLEEDWVPALLV